MPHCADADDRSVPLHLVVQACRWSSRRWSSHLWSTWFTIICALPRRGLPAEVGNQHVFCVQVSLDPSYVGKLYGKDKGDRFPEDPSDLDTEPQSLAYSFQDE